MMMRRYYKVTTLFIVFFGIYSAPVSAQVFAAKNYPQGYFVYPVGAPIGLSANFGELRPNHWHMGLDCKTNKKENMPIYAAAEGYIAKIKIEPFGFGRAIYINHPNGLTTLYAHLNDFYPELEAWLKEQQYARESWRLFLDSIPANKFPVARGQFIANSGNTGGSQGPHLHFEIRDTKSDKALNPMLFGFNIPDAVPPKIARLAVYDRCRSVYEQIPLMMALKQKGKGYTIPRDSILINTEKVSFAITATDAVNGNSNPNGIYEAVVYDNGVPLSGFQLDSIGYDETRYLNAHIDYKLKTNGGPYLQHCSALPGYRSGVYKNFNGDGVVNLIDGQTHRIKIVVKDGNGNAAELEFNIRSTVTGEGTSGCNDSLQVNKNSMFFPRMMNVLDQPGIFFHTSEKTLYDSIRFKYAKLKTGLPLYYSDIHQVHTPNVPAHDYFTVNLKPDIAVPEHLRDRLLMKRTYTGGKFDVFKAKWKGEWVSAAFRGFGNFAIVADTLPPVIAPVGIKNNAVMTKSAGFAFVVTDNNEEIKKFTALLDGKWMLFSNDKGRVFKYRFDNKCAPGPHELKVVAQDEVGNITEKVFSFTR
jgi:hypothetical protein